MRLFLLLTLFIVFSSANKHRSSKEDMIAAAKEYLEGKTFPSQSSSSNVNATQTVINGFEAQVNAMPAGPQKTAALNALNHLKDHAKRNVESFEKKARGVVGKRDSILKEESENDRIGRQTFKGDKPAPIADLDIKIAAMYNNTVMEEYKAEKHAAVMEQMGGAKKRHFLPTKKRFIKK
jgi:hypothetical protein